MTFHGKHAMKTETHNINETCNSGNSRIYIYTHMTVENKDKWPRPNTIIWLDTSVVEKQEACLFFFSMHHKFLLKAFVLGERVRKRESNICIYWTFTRELDAKSFFLSRMESIRLTGKKKNVCPHFRLLKTRNASPQGCLLLRKSRVENSVWFRCGCQKLFCLCFENCLRWHAYQASTSHSERQVRLWCWGQVRYFGEDHPSFMYSCLETQVLPGKIHPRLNKVYRKSTTKRRIWILILHCFTRMEREEQIQTEWSSPVELALCT